MLAFLRRNCTSGTRSIELSSPRGPLSSAWRRKHLEVDRLNLVRERPETGEADSKVAVVGVGQTDPGGFDEAAQLLWVNGLDLCGCGRSLADEGSGSCCRQDRFVRCAIQQAHATLKTTAIWIALTPGAQAG